MPIHYDSPTTRQLLVDGLDQTHQAIHRDFAALSVEELFAPQGEHWSPAEHLDHLCRSVKAVTYAFRMPKLAVMLRFGPSFGASRSFDRVVEIYRRALDDGGRAMGRYLPSDPPDTDARDERRQQLLERWERRGRGLQTAVFTWGDFWLDRCQVPHPLLGKMTCREILHFTLYHNVHHADRVEERRG
ncbi:MAG: DinB family protein [Acidobacteriota bacterium]